MNAKEKNQAIDKMFIDVKPDYLSPDFKAPYELRRYDRGDNRYYYLIEKGKIKGTYISNTSVTSQILPMGEGLKRYIGSLGYEGAQKHMATRAAYGTILHIECVRPILEGSYSFAEFEDRLPKMIPGWIDKEIWIKWYEPLKRDLQCFFLFLKKRVVDVHAVEVPLKSDFWQIAGTGDLIADIKFNKGVVTAGIDYKSGKKGFYEAHELQLKMLKEEWNETFPKQITHLFNVAPVDYRDEVKYKMENQTDKMMNKVEYKGVELHEWELHLLLAKAKGLVRPPKKYETIWGSFKDIKDFDPENHSLVYNL